MRRLDAPNEYWTSLSCLRFATMLSRLGIANRKHGAGPFDDYDELRPCDYSEDDNPRIEPPEDGPPKGLRP
jgi:hypothetical protein